MKKLTLALGLAALLGLGGLTGARAAGTPKDSLFMKDAAAAGMAEVEVARLAVEKATRPEVKAYAQMLADDHSKANDELKALAAQKDVTLPSEPKPSQKAAKERLSKLSGAAFDTAYVNQMVRDHLAAVTLFSRESKTGADPDAKSWAGKILPTLQTHQAKAKELAGPHKAASR